MHFTRSAGCTGAGSCTLHVWCSFAALVRPLVPRDTCSSSAAGRSYWVCPRVGRRCRPHTRPHQLTRERVSEASGEASDGICFRWPFRPAEPSAEADRPTGSCDEAQLAHLSLAMNPHACSSDMLLTCVRLWLHLRAGSALKLFHGRMAGGKGTLKDFPRQYGRSFAHAVAC